jgi:hypothetical protein
LFSNPSPEAKNGIKVREKKELSSSNESKNRNELKLIQSKEEERIRGEA